MYRKRRMFYIIMFIFIPCVILPLIYMAAYFEKFKNGVFNEVSFTAETSDGETIDLSSRYDFKEKVYEVMVPLGIDLSDIVINFSDNGVFEIDDVVYKNGSVLYDIEYDESYDIKMITNDEKLLNEAELVFKQDPENVLMNFNTDDENVQIVSTTDELNPPNHQGFERMMHNGGERRRGIKISAYAKLLTAAFGIAWLYLLYKGLKNKGFFIRRRKNK
ncbi:MAG: hypothetical protein LIO87_09265 [Eubacterium sp.]|nr:hypothetical protein [Eubacterium sp.]